MKASCGAIGSLLLLAALQIYAIQCASSNDGDAKPIVSLNKELNATELASLPNYVFIGQFASYMLTGKYEFNKVINFASFSRKALSVNYSFLNSKLVLVSLFFF